MTDEVYMVGVYWGRRAEALDVCARRLSDCLSRLAFQDGALAEWFEDGAPPSARPIPFSRDRLEQVLLANKHPASGFDLDLQTRDASRGIVRLKLRCGGTQQEPSAPENLFLLELPAEGSAVEGLLGLSKLIQLMDALVRAWEPDWGVVSTKSYAQTARFPPRVPVVAWMTYLSAGRGEVPPLPPPATSMSIYGYGSLVITSGERFSESDAFALNAALSATESLFGAGLLEPTP